MATKTYTKEGIEIKENVGEKEFKTKSKALVYARSYMRKH